MNTVSPIMILVGSMVAAVVITAAHPWNVPNRTVLGAQSQPPLISSNGSAIQLDFSTPTPTPTPTSTPTPTPQPTPTPRPTPTPTLIPVTAEQLDAWFTQYANHYSVDRSRLARIAMCESGLRSNAVNWIYAGMYQFSPNTWIATRQVMNLDPNPALRFNPEEAIKTAAFKLSVRGPGAWPVCGK